MLMFGLGVYLALAYLMGAKLFKPAQLEFLGMNFSFFWGLGMFLLSPITVPALFIFMGVMHWGR